MNHGHPCSFPIGVTRSSQTGSQAVILKCGMYLTLYEGSYNRTILRHMSDSMYIPEVGSPGVPSGPSLMLGSSLKAATRKRVPIL